MDGDLNVMHWYQQKVEGLLGHVCTNEKFLARHRNSMVAVSDKPTHMHALAEEVLAEDRGS